MSLRRLAGLARRAARKPPRVVLRRALDEATAELERYRGPLRARRLDDRRLLRETGDEELPGLWQRLAARPYPAVTTHAGASEIARLLPGEAERIRALAEAALARRVDLLGSGPTELGRPVDWHTDFKSGHAWQRGYAPRLDAADLGRPSDVKVPWELSRMQWLIPVAQAYLLDGDERHAEGVRELLDEWIDANPYADTVNWACTMDVALRAMTWTYFFHVFHNAQSWADEGFRGRFLRSLYLHGDFTVRHLERSDVNGNHYTADAAGLVFVGSFFGRSRERWAETGWGILCDELPRQVFADGVDFEASTAYHRLVLELFLLPALYRLRTGAPVPPEYAERLAAMGRFSAAYSRHDGSIPLWGDADDARALPFGSQALNDHRNLAGVVGLTFGQPELVSLHGGPRSEAAWLHGAEAAAGLPTAPVATGTEAFAEGGFYVLRGGPDHVFVDAGPVGLSGRGGHGHNDCLAFEAVLDGVHLVTDCGAYVYTAAPMWRNRFRSTAFHNTPQVDGEEMNRFTTSLWSLENDARPDVRVARSHGAIDRLTATHSGYLRLASPVAPVRTIVLDRSLHALAVLDTFEGDGEHLLSVPFHLAPGVEAAQARRGRFVLGVGSRRFDLAADLTGGWTALLEEGWASPSYGVKTRITRLRFELSGPLAPLLVALAPAGGADPLGWARKAVSG